MIPSRVSFGELIRAMGPPATRVGLNWRALNELDPAIELRLHRRLPDPQWFTPWYVDGKGEACSFNAAAARPLTLAAAAVAPAPHVRAQRLDELSEGLLREARRTHQGMPQIAAITWALPHEGTLLLDGNHRLVSALRVEVPVLLVEFRIYGPLDPDLLPDLRHHQGAPPIPQS